MIIVVKWYDAGAGETIAEAAQHVRYSVGYLVRRDDVGIWLSMESDQLSGVHFIPSGMVLDVEEMGECPYT